MLLCIAPLHPIKQCHHFFLYYLNNMNVGVYINNLQRGNRKMSDCKYAGATNAAGQLWCDKKNIYVSGKESSTCADYDKK